MFYPLNYGDDTKANVQHPTLNVQRPIGEREPGRREPRRVDEAPTGVEARERRDQSNPHLRFRKPSFYPLNYGDGTTFSILDLRFSKPKWDRQIAFEPPIQCPPQSFGIRYPQSSFQNTRI